MTVAPKVSIVMPVFNAARTLAESVRSVLGQSFPNWELILVDDGSTDGSRDLILDLAKRDDRIRPLLLSTNLGAAGARNAAMDLVQGRYIAFLDSDDVWKAEKLEAQVRFMEHTQAAISFTDYEWIDVDGHPLHVVVQAQDQPTWRDLTWGNNIGLSTSMVDRERSGLPLMPELRLNHDYAMWLEMLRRGLSARRIPEVLVGYRMLPGSLSQNKIESASHNWSILRRREGLSLWETLPRMAFWAFRTTARRLRPRFP